MTFFLLMVLIGNSLAGVKEPVSIYGKINTNNKDSVYMDVSYVEKLKKYIRQNGRKEKINVSSMAGKPKYIDYYVLDHADVRLTIDGTHRIYVNLNNNQHTHIGNVLVQNKKVSIEKGVFPDTDKVYRTYVEVIKKYIVKQ